MYMNKRLSSSFSSYLAVTSFLHKRGTNGTAQNKAASSNDRQTEI